MNDFTIQTLKRVYKDQMEKAIKYYSFLSVWNDLKLPRRKIELLAFTAIRGTISSLSAKKEFIKLFGSSSATINNMISDLSDVGLLEKRNGKYKVPKEINLDFSKDTIISFKLLNPIEGV